MIRLLLQLIDISGSTWLEREVKSVTYWMRSKPKSEETQLKRMS